MELKVTKGLLKLLLQFRCPYCHFSNYDVQEMQIHLVKCGKIKIESEPIKIEPEELDLASRIKAILSDDGDKPSTPNHDFKPPFSPENQKNIMVEDFHFIACDTEPEPELIELPDFHFANEFESKNRDEIDGFHFIACDTEPERTEDPDLPVETKSKTEPKVIKFAKSKKLAFDCKKCDKSYNTKSSLQLHIKIAHLGLRYKCQKCKKVYKSRGNFKDGICIKCFKSADKISKSPKNSKIPKSSGTSKSSKIVKSSKNSQSSRILKSSKKSKNAKSPKNNQISNAFKQRKTPKKNRKTEPKATSEDSESFGYQCSGSEYIMIVTKKNSKYECSKCTRKFSSEAHLAEHFNRIHRKLDFRCKVCNFKFRPFSKYYEKSLLKYYEARAQHANCSK